MRRPEHFKDSILIVKGIIATSTWPMEEAVSVCPIYYFNFIEEDSFLVSGSIRIII
jgi:hypothetical protein